MNRSTSYTTPTTNDSGLSGCTVDAPAEGKSRSINAYLRSVITVHMFLLSNTGVYSARYRNLAVQFLSCRHQVSPCPTYQALIISPTGILLNDRRAASAVRGRPKVAFSRHWSNPSVSSRFSVKVSVCLLSLSLSFLSISILRIPTSPSSHVD